MHVIFDRSYMTVRNVCCMLLLPARHVKWLLSYLSSVNTWLAVVLLINGPATRLTVTILHYQSKQSATLDDMVMNPTV